MTFPGYAALAVGVLAFVLSLFVTPAVIAYARGRGFLDQPGERKVHAQATPTGGGFAVAIAFFAVLWGTSWIDGTPPSSQLMGLTWAGLGALALGFADDLWHLPAPVKLLVQAGLAVVLHQHGFGVDRLSNPFGPPIELPENLALLVDIVWVLAIANAINLIDGLDGLASGIVAISTCTLIAVASGHADGSVVWVGAILAGAVLGFLRYNFPPARIFLGDTGSQFLGMMMAALALLENNKSTTAITLLVPIVAMCLPIVDSALAFLRRWGRGGRIFRADQEHLHHRLLHLGLNQKQAVMLMYYCCVYLGITAYILSVVPRGYVFLILLVLAMGVFLALETLEFLDRKIGRHARSPASRPSTPGEN